METNSVLEIASSSTLVLVTNSVLEIPSSSTLVLVTNSVLEIASSSTLVLVTNSVLEIASSSTLVAKKFQDVVLRTQKSRPLWLRVQSSKDSQEIKTHKRSNSTFVLCVF